MRKVNYQHARKQKEQARKARQIEKQQRRSTRTPAAGESASATPDAIVPPSDPAPGIGT